MNKLLLLSVVFGCLLFAESDSSHFKQEDQDDVHPSYEPVQDPKLVEKCRQKGEVAGHATTEDCEASCLDDTIEPRPVQDCHLMPRERCFCPKGQVRRREQDSECVQIDACPRI